ncbi:MAG: bla regulator protein BlaR1 [Cryomorphaceae bacterium]|jgi:bla regulator protein BlaR1
MNNTLASLWQINIEISLLLMLVMFARYAVRKSTKVYNAYLLWLSIPVGVLAAQLISQIKFSKPPVETVNYLVHSYIVQPAHEYSSWGTLAYVWSALAVILLLRLALQHIQLRRDLKVIEVPTELVSRSSYPVVGIDKDEFSPAVYGFFRPTIYFPVQLENSLSSDQISLIIQHEEHHISQQHLWLNLLWDLLVCFMWFNPLVYIARQNFRHDQELFCDYLVLNKSSQDASRSYGHALLTTVTATHSVSLLCSWKTFNQLEERIMNIKRPTSLSSKIAISLAAIIVVSGVSIYSVSAAQYASQQFRHEVDDDGNSEIVWRTERQTFVEKNGQQYVLNGKQKREPNSQERAAFEVKIEQSNRQWVRDEATAEQELLAHRSIEREHQVLETQRHKHELQRQEQRKYLVESRELAMIERQKHKQQQDLVRREADQQRRETDLQRDTEQRQRDAKQGQRDAMQGQRDAMQGQRDAMQGQRDAMQGQRDAMEGQRDAMDKSRRAADKQRRVMQKQQRKAQKAERADSKGQSEYVLEAMEQQRDLLGNQEEMMEHKKQALEEAKDDLEGSFRAGEISEAQMQEMKRELKRAKRDIERSRSEINKVAEFSKNELERLRDNSYRSQSNIVPPSAPAVISRLEASLDPIRPESAVFPEAPVAPIEQDTDAVDRVYDMRLAQ